MVMPVSRKIRSSYGHRRSGKFPGVPLVVSGGPVLGSPVRRIFRFVDRRAVVRRRCSLTPQISHPDPSFCHFPRCFAHD